MSFFPLAVYFFTRNPKGGSIYTIFKEEEFEINQKEIHFGRN